MSKQICSFLIFTKQFIVHQTKIEIVGPWTVAWERINVSFRSVQRLYFQEIKSKHNRTE